jgi:hypothetical protein
MVFPSLLLCFLSSGWPHLTFPSTKAQEYQHHLSYVRFFHTLARVHFDLFAVITKSPLLFIPSTIPHAMARSHSESVSHTHNRPGTNCCNLRDPPKHASQQPYQDKLDVRHTSSHIPASGDVATKGSSASSSSRPSTSAGDTAGSQPNASLPNGQDDSSRSGDKTANEPDNAPGPAEIMRMILTPPVSHAGSSAKHQKFHVFHSHCPHRRLGPIYPQPPSPSKERIGEFNKHQNESNRKYKASRDKQSNSGSGNDTQTGNSSDDSGTGAQPGKPLVDTDDNDDTKVVDDSDGTDDSENSDNSNATDSATDTSDDSDDGGVSILEKMLSPPESDPDTKPQSNQQEIRAFHCHYGPTRRSGLFIPQRPEPSKERKGEFNCRSNKINMRRKSPRTRQASSDNDGDDELEDDVPDDSHEDSPEDAGTGAPPSTPKDNNSTTTTHLGPPDTPRPMTRSQSKLKASDSTTSPPNTAIPSPSHPLKRKRDYPNTNFATPTKGERISKRRRNSTGTSPLPPVKLLKRTRAQQKRFEAKMSKDLVYDEEFPGSARRESVDVKVGPSEWRRISLHGEAWDGSGK